MSLDQHPDPVIPESVADEISPIQDALLRSAMNRLAMGEYRVRITSDQDEVITRVSSTAEKIIMVISQEGRSDIILEKLTTHNDGTLPQTSSSASPRLEIHHIQPSTQDKVVLHGTGKTLNADLYSRLLKIFYSSPQAPFVYDEVLPPETK